MAEYINWSTRNIIINKEERTFIKNITGRLTIGSIFYASLNGPDWTQKYVKDYPELHIHSGSFESPILLTPPNTQITSFGMGKLFVQIFTCPVERASDSGKIEGSFAIVAYSERILSLHQGVGEIPGEVCIQR